ncbi:hypothetical protein LPJ66_003684 [Kickxella alabastrina]|uniref:Uncharacterized protein n=1 Tax=Kickxella alabastrina TaxID=61397 RepID=A0ACC1IMP9_9FUNG|nr:hypothetical protein LPJ66_003684 [Kickxella alabastrina]
MPTRNNNGSDNSNDSSDDEIPQFTTNSCILGESEAFVYYYSCKADNFVKRPVDQIYGPNGKLYIEHIPGHSIITLPKTVPIQRPTRRIAQKKPAKNNSNIGFNGKPAKPNNVFIRYRCANSGRIKKIFPNATQTDLSRIAAEYWRNETVEGKERFYSEYNAEYSEYIKKFKQWEIQTKQLEIMCYEEFQPQMMSMASVVVPTPAHYESSADFSGAGPINHLGFGDLPGFNQKRRRSYSMPAHRFIAKRIPKQSDKDPACKRQRAYPMAEPHFN